MRHIMYECVTLCMNARTRLAFCLISGRESHASHACIQTLAHTRVTIFLHVCIRTHTFTQKASWNPAGVEPVHYTQAHIEPEIVQHLFTESRGSGANRERTSVRS